SRLAPPSPADRFPYTTLFRSQAGADPARWTADAGGAGAGHLPGRTGQPGRPALAVSATRAERQDDLGPAAEPRRAGGRNVLHPRSEEHTSELQSRVDTGCRLL